MIEFNVKKDGNLDFEKRLRMFTDWANNNLAGELGDIAYEHFIKAFPSSTSSKGGKQTDASKGGWTPRKVKQKYPILNRTGKLKNSIHVKKRRRSATVYTNLNYASYHNYGIGRLPKREFIGKSRALILKSRKYIYNGMNSIFKSVPRKPMN